jgi:hypothetical protein
VAMSASLVGLAVWRGWQQGLRPYVPYLAGGALLQIRGLWHRQWLAPIRRTRATG